MPNMTMVEAIRNAMDVSMARDDNVVVFGEDVGYFGGVFRATLGLQQKYGKQRCFDTPISELGIVGTAIGMAAYGLRPCVEVQFADYVYPAYDQIVSEAARLRYRSNGEFTCPIVVRMPTGGGIFGGQTHRQSPEALFTHVCGLKTVVPSNPRDAKGLLIAAIEDPDPVIFLEPKRLYNGPFDGHHDRPVTPWSNHELGEVPDGHYAVPLGTSAIRREGAALTIFTLPESPLFLLSHNRNGLQALDTLRRITGTQTLTGIARAKSTATKKTTSAIHGLFGDGRLLMTLLFWLITGVLLMGFYFLVNWTPTLLVRGGFSAKTAALGSALLNVGGAVPGLGVGQFSDRWGGRRVMSAIFVAGGLSLALAGASSGSAPLLMVTIVLAGTAWIAGQAAMVMLVARSYPDEIRTTGVGWTLTAGFVGAMVSPAIVAIPFGLGWTPARIVLIPVIPALLSAVGILCAAPPAGGHRITGPKPAVKATTAPGE